MSFGEWGPGQSTRIFRVKISWLAALQRCQTGFYLRDVGISNMDPQEVAEHATVWVQAQFPSLLHTDDQLLGIDVQNLTDATGHSIEYANLKGTITGERAPTFMMVAVALKGEMRKRYGQGRMLWPVSGEVYMQGQGLSASGLTTYQGNITTLASRYIGASLTHDLRLVNIHEAKPLRAAGPAMPARWYDVTSIRLNNLLSSIRRRKTGIGS